MEANRLVLSFPPLLFSSQPASYSKKKNYKFGDVSFFSTPFIVALERRIKGKGELALAPPNSSS